MNHPFVEQLARELATLSIFGPMLAAVSGGADSVALLRGLVALRATGGLDFHVAHLDHRLRGDAAREDAAWVQQLCVRLGVPFTIGCVDVAAVARHSGCGIEETARAERYRFLEETARSKSCRAVALAHTADDQAETVLHHVLRGTGLAGLRGIRRERTLDSGIRLIRPLLEIDRCRVLGYLSHVGQDFREDATNLDVAFTRNRLRQQLLPLLARDYNPLVAEALRRLGRQAADAQETLEVLAEQLLERVLDSAAAHACRLKWQPLISMPRHLVREALSLLWRRQDWPRQKMSFQHWDRLAGIALSGGAALFPGEIDARREGRWLVVRSSCHSQTDKAAAAD